MESSNDDASHYDDVPRADGQQQEQGKATSSVAPIHWQHRRYESYVSIGHTKPPPITLEDNTEEIPDIKSPLWAKAVTIDDHVVVSGSVRGVGEYTIWNCRIDTLDVSPCSTFNLCIFFYRDRCTDRSPGWLYNYPQKVRPILRTLLWPCPHS